VRLPSSAFRSPLWRNRAFVRIWTASTISIFGSLITRLALPLLAIIVLDAGAIEVAVLRSIDLAATLIVGLVAGAWVDRLLRRRVLIWADLGRAILLGSIPVAAVGGWLTFAQLLAVTFAAAVLTSFFDAADNAYLPTIVERERLVEANSALAASGSAAEFTAFGISGILVQVLSAPFAVALDAVSFLVSAVFIGGIRQVEPPPPRKSARSSVYREIRTGLRLVVHDPILRSFASAQMAMAALWGVFGATYILFALDELDLGPAALGVITGLGGLGSLIGALVAQRSTRRWGIGPVAIGAMLLAALGNALIPLAPAGAPFLAALFLAGQQLIGDSAVTVYDVTETTVRQTLVGNRELGRVTSTFRVAAGLAQLVATIGAGLLAEAIGLRATAVLAPIGGLIGAAILFAGPVRRLVRLPAAASESDAFGASSTAEVVVQVGRDEPIGG
jgi:predicted MFS family arabinose efflux permease